VLAQLAAVALALAVTRPHRLGRHDRGLVLAGLAYALPLVPAELSTFVMSTADRLIVRHELGLTEVGRYQLAYNLGAVPAILITILNIAWMPRIFALAAGRERADVLAASRDALYLLLMPVMIGLSLGMPILLRLWAPAEYRPDTLLLVAAWVIVQVVPYTAALSATRGLLAAGRSGAVAVAAVAGAVANIVLNLLLVPGLHLLGAAVATTGAYVVMHAVLMARSRTVAPTPRPRPARLAALALATAATLLVAELPTGPAFLVARGVLAAATVVWFVAILRQLGRTAGGRAT
jgi:O-antigen/teichoic acid export membrane protein